MASRRFDFKFHLEKDKEIIDRLESQENMQSYIRNLILSDIAADILRASIKLEEDPEEIRLRNEWYEEHCPAIGDPDYDCTGCYYHRFGKDDVAGTGAGFCDADSYFYEYLEDLNHGKV